MLNCNTNYTETNRQRISQADVLRGLAALSVAWFHFLLSHPFIGGIPALIGKYGWIGVEVFFVISGFVIPYSLYRSGHQYHEFSRFILRRLIRLEPPYILTIILTLCLNKISSLLPGFRGVTSQIDWVGTLLHLGYFNVFGGHEWLLPTFWTLAIEFQFYLLIGVVYPVIYSQKAKLRLTWFFCALLFSLWSTQAFVFYWLPLFCMGILAFQYYIGLWRSAEMLLLLGACVAVGGLNLGLLKTFAGLLAVSVIIWIPIKNRYLVWLGTISYSVYLLHPIIGGRVLNFAERFVLTPGAKIAALCCAVIVTLIVSWCFHKLVEVPAQNWARKFM